MFMKGVDRIFSLKQNRLLWGKIEVVVDNLWWFKKKTKMKREGEEEKSSFLKKPRCFNDIFD